MTHENIMWWICLALFPTSAVIMIVSYWKKAYDKATFYLLLSLIFLGGLK